MPKNEKASLSAKGIEISLLINTNNADYFSLTDIARYKSDDPAAVIQNWMRNRDTIEFLGLWEELNNPHFKPLEFEGFRREAGRNAFTLSPQKWIKATGALGIQSKSGRYGGTYAHIDIAMEFTSWISPEFKLYIIKDYQRLKTDEGHRQAIEWSAKRELAKVNYRIHTDAIKENLIPQDLSPAQINYTYANEADMLNVALFGQTAREWREQNPEAAGNMRDHASIHQLIILVNMESMNAELIKQGVSQKERLTRLHKMAVEQMRSLVDSVAVQRLAETIVPSTQPMIDSDKI